MNPVQCAFPYYGGKTQYADDIVGLMPDHRTYVEPFGGGASVLLAKPRSSVEVFNDYNDDLVRFFRVLRDRPDDLKAWLSAAPYSKTEHQKWAPQFVGDGEVPDSVGDVARAGRWFVLMHTQYASKTNSVSGFSSSKVRNEANAMRSRIGKLDDLKERFGRVVVECDDYANILSRYDSSDTLWYFDPPYVDHTHEYPGEFTHPDFVESLATLDGDWIVSYRELPDGLRDLGETVRTLGGTDAADGRKEATETLVLSYDPGETAELTDTAQTSLGGVGE